MTVEQPDVAPTVVPWATADDVPATVRDAVSADVLAGALEASSAILWALTGRRWAGVSQTTVAVEPRRCTCWRVWVQPLNSYDPTPYLDGTEPIRHTCAHADQRLVLPDYPVQAVSSVVGPDNTGWSAANLDVVNGRTVALLDDDGAEAYWPSRRFVVTYTHGSPPPKEGRRFAALYAAQLALAAAGVQGCKLPSRVQTVTRQGVTLAMLDPFEFLDKGRTGLPDVDTWVVAVNPHQLTSRPKVWSPDTDRRETSYRRQ